MGPAVVFSAILQQSPFMCPLFFHLFLSLKIQQNTQNAKFFIWVQHIIMYSEKTCFCIVIFIQRLVLLLRLFSVVFLQEGKQKLELLFYFFLFLHKRLGSDCGSIGVIASGLTCRISSSLHRRKIARHSSRTLLLRSVKELRRVVGSC
jgi:hypothetical protein